MERNIERALLNAVCTLIDKGEFSLGKEEAETPEEEAVVHFFIGLRVGSCVGLRAPNVWYLHPRTVPNLAHTSDPDFAALSEPVFARIWDNDVDAEYDDL